MSDSENKKPRRSLNNLPPDRFQPKMLLFWLALVAAVLALLPDAHAANAAGVPDDSRSWSAPKRDS
jgi:hypothetical protein